MQEELSRLFEIAKRVGATRSFNPDFWSFSGDCPLCSRGEIVVDPISGGGAEVFCTEGCPTRLLLKATHITEKELWA